MKKIARKAAILLTAAMLPVISGTIAQNIMVVAAGSALEHILGDEVRRG